MITMRNMVAKAAQWPIRAFTLLESLVTLAVVAFLTLSLSGSVTGIFQQVETNLFYLRFEYLYRDSQRLAAAEGSNVELQLSKDKISNGKSSLVIPKNIHLDKGQTLSSLGSNEVGLGRTEGAAIAVVALVAIFNQAVDAGGLCLEIERLALVARAIGINQCLVRYANLHIAGSHHLLQGNDALHRLIVVWQYL